MNETFLTRDEIQELTGYRIPSRQIRWLEANAIPFFVNARQLPVVVRAAMLARNGVKQQNQAAGEFELGEVA